MIWPGPTVSIMISCVDRPRMLLQNIHNHVCTRLYGVLTQNTLQILTTVSTSNPVPKFITTATLMEMSHWENWIISEQYIFYTVFIIIYFIHRPWTLLYIASQKTVETNHSQYKYIFCDQDHIRWISNLYHYYTTRKLNFWLWSKTAYMTMKSYRRLFNKCIMTA
jgi:hypothetical protein